jgi:hypothetical protein
MNIIGVVKDALMDSPFQAADPSLFFFDGGSNIIYRLSPNVNTHEAIEKVSAIFNSYSPASPFTYRFVDDDYNQKFNLELLVGKLAGIFAGTGHIYIMPWFIWPGCLCCRTTHKRDWCTQSIRSNRSTGLVAFIKRFCFAGGNQLCYCVTRSFLFFTKLA